MELYQDQGCDGIELLDWLFDQNEGILRHEESGRHGNHHVWPIQDPNMLQSAEQGDDDFLKALLTGNDSVSGSPLWSPSPSDSGISEDPPSDQMDSPQRPESPHGDAQYFPTRPQTKAALEGNISIDFNAWEPAFPMGRTRITEYPSDVHRPQLSSGFPLTVKDLLLSGTAEAACGSRPIRADQAFQEDSHYRAFKQKPQHPSQQSIQELILNEDEKKLLAKEGVTLPSQLPLTKYEERILKKIRRKIRNKQSAQESRKKKKEYIDGLESRMAACNAHNQELQRKVSQLEKCNMSLMEQLRRLQALIMNTSKKPAQTGTCVLVLLLSFSLILFPSLKPFSDNKVSQGDFSPVRIQSRSLQNLQASRVLHVTEPPFSPEDESEPLHRHFPGDQEFDDVTSLMGKLLVSQDGPDLEPLSLNGSQEDRMGHYHVDPITGHIATLTLDPQRSGRLRPHADDM